MIATTDAFETSCYLDVTPGAAWPRIALDPQDKSTSAANAALGAQVWLPGWEMTGEVLENDAGKRLRLRKDTQPCKNTEILIELAAEAGGTRVRLVQSGFAVNARGMAMNILGIGADFIFRDFALYLETGVLAHRHMSAWAVSFGAEVREGAAGLQITNVSPNSFAARAGLQEGDRLLTLAGASVITLRDLVLVLRGQQGQASVPVFWVRGTQKMSGNGVF